MSTPVPSSTIVVEAPSGAAHASIEHVVDKRVISQKGFLLPPSPETSIEQLKNMILSLQHEIQFLKQGQKESNTAIRSLKLQQDRLSTDIQSLGANLSLSSEQQQLQIRDFQTRSQEQWREDIIHTWSIQKQELELSWGHKLGETMQREQHQQHVALQNLQNLMTKQMDDSQRYMDTRITAYQKEWRDMEQRIQAQHQQNMDRFHNSWQEQLVHQFNQWEDSQRQEITSKIQEKMMENNAWENQVQKQLQDQYEAFVQQIDRRTQDEMNKRPTEHKDGISELEKTIFLQKMEDKCKEFMHQYAQQISRQYKDLEATWRKKFEYMSERYTLLEKHFVHGDSQPSSKSTLHEGPTTPRAEEVHSETKTNTTSTGTKQESMVPPSTYSYFQDEDDDVETIKVVPPPCTSSNYEPETKRTKMNPPPKESSRPKDQTTFCNSWIHSSSTTKKKPGFNFNLNQESALEEQERLFRESAERVRAQQEELRRKRMYEESFPTFVEPLEDLTKLPMNSYKFPDMYARLGLPPNASHELVKKHYRKLCLIYHPDKDKSGDAENGLRFQGIKEAYESIMPK